MSEQDKEWWIKIFNYVEKEVLGYDQNQHLQKAAVLRLKGLENGKIIANNSTPDNGSYPLEVVYGAIVYSKQKYLDAKQYKNFKTEANEIAYFCAIVRANINTVYTMWASKKHQESIVGSIQFEEKHKGASYKPKARKAVAAVSGDFW